MERHHERYDMLIGLLMSMYTVNGLKRVMLESMPIASMPSGTKASLIKKLVDWVCDAKTDALIYGTVLAPVPKQALLRHLS